MSDKSTKDLLDEEYPILMQKDFQKSIKNLAELPDYLRKINQNILNIDKRISKRELNTDKVKQFEGRAALGKNANRSDNNLLEIKDLVKQSVESISDIFRNKGQLNAIKPIKEEDAHVNCKQIQPQKAKNTNVNSIQKQKTIQSNIAQVKSSKKDNVVHPNQKKPSAKTVNKKKDYFIASINNNKDNTMKSSKAIVESKEKKPQVIGEITYPIAIEAYAKPHQSKQISAIAASKKPSSVAQAYCQGYNEKINRSNNNNPLNGNSNTIKRNQNITSTIIKESKANEQASIQLKPKQSQEGTSNISIIHESKPIKAKNKPQAKQKGLNEKPIRLSTDSNQGALATNKHSKHIKMERNDSTKRYYKKHFPKKLSIEDVLRMQLLLTALLANSNELRDYKMNAKLFENFSLLLSHQLKDMTEHPFDKEVTMNSMLDSNCESIVAKSAVKLQRKWRQFKLKQFNYNDKQVLTSAVINNLIANEGIEAQRMVKAINATAESFVSLKNSLNTVDQLSDVTLSNITEDERYKLYKNLINCHLMDQTHRVNPGSSMVHNLNEESSYNAILSSFRKSQSKQKQ